MVLNMFLNNITMKILVHFFTLFMIGLTNEIEVCKIASSSNNEVSKHDEDSCSTISFFEENLSNIENKSNNATDYSAIDETMKELKDMIKEANQTIALMDSLQREINQLDNQFEELKVCANNPCVNGSCSFKNNDYFCSCHPGFIGRNCDRAISSFATYRMEIAGRKVYTLLGKSKYDKAQKMCKLIGGNLATQLIRNNSSRKAIAALVSDNLWVGLKRDPSNKQWNWIDGVRSTRKNTPWDPNAKNTGGCTVLKNTEFLIKRYCGLKSRAGVCTVDTNNSN